MRLYALRPNVLMSLIGLCGLTACQLIHQPEVKVTPTYEQHAYFNRMLFVYPKQQLFHTVSAQMKPGAGQQLEPVVAYAQSRPDLVIQIRAFDNDAAQSTVSSERVDFEAEAVAAYLWTQRVSNTLRYSGVGRGQHPVSTNRVASIGAANSRIEIEFLYDGK